MENKIIIVLSTEGDYFKSLDDTTFKSTLNIQEATHFNSVNDAARVIHDLAIPFVWPEVSVQEV